MNVNKLCMGCMTEMQGDYAFCPKCGRKVDEINSARGLQPHTVLNGKYIIGRVLGEGGFGITYIAYDTVLNNRVAIKEYFPSELVSRDTSNGGNTSLSVLTGSKEEQYKKGIERFIKEASNLAKFNNLPGIVSVKEFFYANNTAYMVMEYIEGITLSKFLKQNGERIPSSKVLEMMIPVMDSLEKVHSAGIIHRDISPDNIMITKDGRIKLIDFGAARIVDNKDVKSLTVILKHGFAPEEQYHPDGHQGPWTDVYALSATMYRMITGIVPQESTDRILSGDKLIAVNKIEKDVSKKVSDAIMHGLSVKASNRPQNISEFKKELQKGKASKAPFIIIGGLAAMLLLTIIIGAIVASGIFIFRTINNKNNEPQVVADNNIDDKDYSSKKDNLEDKENKEDIDNTENNEKVETEPEKETEDEKTPEEDVEIIKELTEEEKLALWREYQDKIMDTVKVSFYAEDTYDDWIDYYFDGNVPDAEKELYGCFDDFDGDGDYELFFLIYGDCGSFWDTKNRRNYLFYADDKGVWYGEEKVTADSQSVIGFRDEVDNFIEIGFEYLVPDVLGEAQLGKQKFCYYYQQPIPYGEYVCYTVIEDVPKFYEVGMQNINGVTVAGKKAQVGYYTEMDETVYFDQKEIYYSPYYFDGKFGELASCRLNDDQWASIDGLIDQINIQADYIKDNPKECEMGNDGARHVFYEYFYDDYNIISVSIDSVLYNEAGYFIFNYKCECDFWRIHPQSYTENITQPYYVSMTEKEDPEVQVEYTGSDENRDTDIVEGIEVYSIVKYDGSTYSLVTCGNGYIGESVTDNVLLTSECPWVE